jgi:hypothetical protein
VPGVRSDADVNGLRIRMPYRIGQRFLNHPIETRAVLVWQSIEVALDPEIDRDRVPPSKVPNEPFERGLQAEVIQHAGTQAQREVPNGPKHAICALSGAVNRSSRPSSIRNPVSTCAT